jgi:hypothetical protein
MRLIFIDQETATEEEPDEELFYYINCIDCGESVPIRAGQKMPIATRCNSCKDHKGLWKKAIVKKTDGNCAYCGQPLPPKFHRDHIIPKSRGGPSLADNLVACCPSCNSRKSTKTLSEFRDWIKEQAIHTAELDDKEWLQDFIPPTAWNMIREYQEQATQLFQEYQRQVTQLFNELDDLAVIFELDRHDVKLFMGGTLGESENG